MNADDFLQLTGIESYYPVLLDRFLGDLGGYSYSYMAMEDFARLDALEVRQRVYWFEILERAHCGALTSLLRLQRWLEAMRVAAESENYLNFAAAFRGLLEAAADSRYSFGDVPRMLAIGFPVIFEAVHGRSRDLTVSPELEDALIHFSHARRVSKGEQAPETHLARQMKEYITRLQGAESGPFHDAYADLCNITHPAADSILYLLEKGQDGFIRFQPNPDDAEIRALCGGGGTVVRFCVAETMAYAAVVLRLLNRFDLSELHTPAADAVSLHNLPLWQEISRLLAPSQAKH